MLLAIKPDGKRNVVVEGLLDVVVIETVQPVRLFFVVYLHKSFHYFCYFVICVAEDIVDFIGYCFEVLELAVVCHNVVDVLENVRFGVFEFGLVLALSLADFHSLLDQPLYQVLLLVVVHFTAGLSDTWQVDVGFRNWLEQAALLNDFQI
jgi:hypothetical protein